MTDTSEPGTRAPEPAQGHKNERHYNQALRKRERVIAVTHLLHDKTSQHEPRYEQEQKNTIEKVNGDGR